MFQSNLPKMFWGKSILIAAYIVKKLLSVTLDWKSPYEALYDTEPNYTFLRTFGCLRYATNVLPFKDKFDPRAKKCIFIGYCSGQKTYKLFDLVNKKVIMSRDVVFHEHIFPYFKNSYHATSTPLLCITDFST